MSICAQSEETLEYLEAHVLAVHRGLQAVLHLLHQVPDGQTVQAASVAALLEPLADQAQQAQPLARLVMQAYRKAL